MTVRERKIKCYRELSFAFGFITLCYLMDVYTQEENYEECQLILEALQQLSELFDMPLPTHYDENAIQYFKQEIHKIKKTSGDIALSNVPYYAMEVEYEVSQIK